jgi:hypothetical protein
VSKDNQNTQIDLEDIPAEKPEAAKGEVSIKAMFNPFVKLISSEEAAALISSFTPPPIPADFKPKVDP